MNWRHYIATPAKKYRQSPAMPPRKIEVKQLGLSTGKIVVVNIIKESQIMSDELKFVITVVFPADKVDINFEASGIPEGADVPKQVATPQYALKYLFITNLIEEPEWEEDDPRWAKYDWREEVWKRFQLWARKHIKADFTGQMLFIDPVEYVIANGRAKVL